jgi:hypothetical protein
VDRISVSSRASAPAPELVPAVESFPVCFALSADGRVLAGVDESGVLFTWRRGEPGWRRVAELGSEVTALAWARDGLALAAGFRDGRVAVVEPGGTVRPLGAAGSDPVEMVAFMAGDEWVASASADVVIVVRERAGGAERRRWSDVGWACAAAGDWLLTVDYEDNVLGWHVEAEDGPAAEVAAFQAGPLGGFFTDLAGLLAEQGLFAVAMGPDRLVLHAVDPDAELLRMDAVPGEHFFGVAASPAGVVALSRWSDSADSALRLELYDLGAVVRAAPAGDPAAASRVLAEVHAAFLANPHEGRVRWFQAFDERLVRGDFPVARALLADVRTGPWEVTAEELRYVESREGALLLYEGALHQRAGRLDEADACYRESLALQKRAGRSDAVAQVQRCLSELERQRATGTRPDALLTLGRRLQALRNPEGEQATTASEWLLMHRLELEEPPGRCQVLEVALRERFWRVGARALEADEPWTRLRGAALLGQLHETSAAAREVLLQAACEADEAFVRWRAAEALLRLLTEADTAADADELAAVRSAFERESDPDVRVALLRVAALAGGGAVPLLLQALDDDDPDVRLAAAPPLGALGVRRALGPLREARYGYALLDLPHEEHPIDDAIAAILERSLSVPMVTDLHATPTDQRAPADVFTPGEVIRLRWRAASLRAPVAVRARWHPAGAGAAATLVDATWDPARDPGGDPGAGSAPAVVAEAAGPSLPPPGFIGDAPERFPLGTRVRATQGEENVPVGSLGTVVANEDGLLGVSFDNDIDGGTLSGRAPDSHGWWMLPEEVERIGTHAWVGERVVMVDPYLVDERRIPAGAFGTVREVDSTNAGVEWDDNVGGHALSGVARMGHGWWVPHHSVALLGSFSLRLDSGLFGELAGPGELVLEAYDPDGGAEPGSGEDAWVELGRVSAFRLPPVEIVGVTHHVGGAWGGSPGVQTERAALPLRRMVTRVACVDGWEGAVVHARVLSPDGMVVGDRERVLSTDEAEEGEILFEWDTGDWPPGEYRVSVSAGRREPWTAAFTLERRPRIVEAVLVRERGPGGAPAHPLTSFASDEPQVVIATRVEAGAPPLDEVEVRVRWQGGNGPAGVWRARPENPAAGWVDVVLTRPGGAWPLGHHQAVLRPAPPPAAEEAGYDGAGEVTIAFRVVAPSSRSRRGPRSRKRRQGSDGTA